MHTPQEIRSTIRKIENEQREMEHSENRFRQELETLSAWWKGEAGKAFAQEYQEAGHEINRLFSEINNLENGMSRLAAEVQRADDERRRKELMQRQSVRQK